MRLFDWFRRGKEMLLLLDRTRKHLSNTGRFQNSDDIRREVQLAAKLHFANWYAPLPCLVEYGCNPCPLCVLFGDPEPNPDPHTRIRLRDLRGDGYSDIVVARNSPLARLLRLVGEDHLCLDREGKIGLQGSLEAAYHELLLRTRPQQQN